MNIITRLMTTLLLFISIEGFGQVSVTATAGTATGSYATLNAAFAAINAGTHQGAINISITGNTTEPSPPTSLVGSGVGSASYISINISPSGGSWTVNSSAVPFAYRGIIELFGAQHVTIDGDPAGTGTRNLTFAMTPTSNVEVSVIRLGSIDSTGTTGAANDTIKNCIINGGLDSAASSSISYGILCSGNSITNAQTPASCGSNNLAFIHNTFTRAYYGLSLLGSSTLGNQNVLVRDNDFGTNTAATSVLCGLLISSFNPGNYTNNTIRIDSNDFNINNNSTSLTAYGINQSNNTGTTIISNNSFYGVVSDYIGINSGVSNIYKIVMNINNNNFDSISCNTFTAITTYITIPFGSSIHNRFSYLNNQIENCAGNTMQGIIHNRGVIGISYDTVIVQGNYINNIGSSAITGMGLYSDHYILCDRNFLTNFNGITVVRGIVCSAISGIISNNNVNNLISTNTGGALNPGGSVIGIASLYISTVYNNFIGNLSSKSDSTQANTTASTIGLELAGGECFYNTIALNVPSLIGSVANVFSAAVWGGSNVSFTDNIVVNTQNSSNAFGYYIPNTSYSTDTADFNNYYVPFGNVGYAGSAQTALLNWQAATSQDIHSVSGPVPFISTSNLHIDTLNADANNVFRNGTYITSVTTDIDGQTRNNPPCIGADEFYAVNALPDSVVWPGDADNNLVVNNLDLLPIGLGYDSTGPVRTVTGIVWQGDAANNWANYFSIYLPLVNFVHADCNGDGVINALDTAAIAANYGDIHSKTANRPGPWRSGIPALYLKISQDTVYNDSILVTNIFLGDSATPVNNIYGLAFTFNYDPLVIDSNYSMFSFIPSWLGNSSNSINISRNFATGQVQAAITGIDHTARSGSGQIASFVGEITTSNINGKTYSYYDNINYISNVTAIDQYGNPVPLNAGIDSDYVGFFTNGIKPISAPTVSIYPNPAATQVRISADAAISGATVTDMLGETVQTVNGNNQKAEMVDISALSDGVYIMHISAAGGTATAKLVVSR